MKKLMIAAAAAAMIGGAFADDCGEKCAWGYKMKVIVKTTTSESVTNAATCTGGCYRKPAIRRYIGYFFGKSTAEAGTCGTSTCSCWDPSTDAIQARLAMWNFDTKEPVTPGTTDMLILNRIGKDDTTRAELAFETTYTKDGTDVATGLTFAGFGQCAKTASGMKAVKTASGYCAGTVPGVCYACQEECGSIVEDSCVITPAKVWNLCDKEGTSYMTAAFGKWAMQWDAEIVERITNGKTVVGDSVDATTGFTPAGYQTGKAGEVKYDNFHFITDAE